MGHTQEEDITPSQNKRQNQGAASNPKWKYSCLFIAIALGAIAILFLVQWLSFNAMKNSQKEIVAKFCEHIEKVDSAANNLNNYALGNMLAVQMSSGKVVADSLIKASLGNRRNLTANQQKALIDAIGEHFSNLADARSEYETKFLKDSLLLSAERTLLQGQTKNMLELHLSQIQHQYSNITMWAAILTVVFLVFSFYSMFKLDEYIVQGKEAVKTIEKLREDSDSEIQHMTNSYEATLKSTFERIDSTADAKLNTFNTRIDSIITAQEQQIPEKIDKIVKSIQKVADQKIDNINSRYEEMEGKITSLQEILNRLNEI